MKKKKNNKWLVILICIFGVLVLGGFIIYDKVFTKPESEEGEKSNLIDNNKDNQITGDPISEVVISNSEVKNLYDYVQPSLISSSVCLGYYYQNPFKNHRLEDKISLVLINYAGKYRKKIDSNFLNRVSQSDRELVANNSKYYIESSVVKEGLKFLFNIDVDKFDDNANYTWDYRSDANAFVEIVGAGDYQAEIVQQVIDYKELNDEINLIVVKAELGYDNNVYRYVNKENTLVYSNIADSFKFTEENINKFPQLKYIFKKNNNGKYYVSDIINLNFESDFEDCN